MLSEHMIHIPGITNTLVENETHANRVLVRNDDGHVRRIGV